MIAISASGNFQNSTLKGRTKIFRNIANTWTQVGQNIEGENVGDNLGYELSFSSDGSRLAISSIDSDNGYVKVFQNVSNVWTQMGQNLNGNALDDQFGRNIHLSSSGEILVVGAILSDVNGTNSGTVSVYKFESNTWNQVGNYIHGDIYSALGWGIAISGNGNVIAAGAPSSITNVGKVKIYQNISNTWTQVGITLNGDNSGDNFGNSLDLSEDGTTLAIGAWGVDVNGGNSGQVKVFNITSLLSSDSFVLENCIGFSMSLPR